MSLTTDPSHPDLQRGQTDGPVPQNKVYLVLSDEERAKGFVRPVRKSYLHVGRKYDGPLEMIDPRVINDKTYVAIAPVYSNGKRIGGAYLMEHEVQQFMATGGYVGGCHTITTMATPIAETYARNPSFYGATYCCHCMRHVSVGECHWEGTNEKVGS